MLSKMRAAFSTPLIAIIAYTVFYAFAYEKHSSPFLAFDTWDDLRISLKDEDDMNGREGLYDSLREMGAVFLPVCIVLWLIWAGLLALNIVNRLRCAPDQTASRPADPGPSSFDQFTKFPLLHWIAVGVWSLGIIGFILGLMFTIVLIRSVLFIAPGHFSGDCTWNPLMPSMVSGYIGGVLMLIFAAVGLGIFGSQLLARAVGHKGTTSCCSYNLFLFGPIQPVIMAAILTIIFAVGSATTVSPVHATTLGVYAELAESSLQRCVSRQYPTPIATLRYTYAMDLWNDVKGLGAAVAAFMGLTWAGAAALTFFNVWPLIAAKAKVENEQEQSDQQQQPAPPPPDGAL
jgi:hypothetical protein